MSTSTSRLKYNIHCTRTKNAYRTAIMKFLSYCEREGIDDMTMCDPGAGASSYSYHMSMYDVMLTGLDNVVSEYIDDLYVSGGKYYSAANLLHALYHYIPICKGKLLESSLAVRGWNATNAKSRKHKVPLTRELTMVLAMSMFNSGHVLPAIATLLCYECYLRISELCSLRICDIALPSSLHFGGAYTGMAIGLARTKTGLHQSVTVRDDMVVQLVTALVHARKLPLTSTALLFNMSAYTYRKIFMSALRETGLHSHYITPHSMRHGAATADYISQALSLEAILLRGRWSVSKSVRIYIQSGVYLSISVKEAHLQALGAALLSAQHRHPLITLITRKLCTSRT